MKKILVVGAGFAGSVIARELAEAGYYITIIDSRNHIAGNCYDYIDACGIRVHQYGPHIWHTNNETAHTWFSKFTDWIPYKHRVQAKLENGLYVPLPINYKSINFALGLQLKNNEEAENFLKTEREIPYFDWSLANSYESICARLGKRLCDIFFAPYTKKMWGIELQDLDGSVAGRVSIDFQDDPLYFPNDKFQFMPKDGYTNAFNNILSHENIKIRLNTPFEYEMESEYYHIFNCMPIDVYFKYEYGKLPYRSLKFHSVTTKEPSGFPVPTVNFTTQKLPYTRVTDWKKYPNAGESPYTIITYEEPCCYTQNNEERYYPVKDLGRKNISIYHKYKELANKTKNNMTFCGRQGTYTYTDMHQAINMSLITSKKFIAEDNGKSSSI